MKKKDGGMIRDRRFWRRLRKYNDGAKPVDSFLSDFGMSVMDQLYLGYSFVIPGQTVWKCKRCGDCCKCIGTKSDPDAHICPELVNDRCRIYASRPVGCRNYPFFKLESSHPVGDLLLVHDCCWGVGQADPPDAKDEGDSVITLDRYDEILSGFPACGEHDDGIIIRTIEVPQGRSKVLVFDTPPNRNRFT